MRILFRADASVQIGTGHVMRCLTLADELTRQGHKCRFICREQVGHLGDRIASNGYELNLLPHSWKAGHQASVSADNIHADWLGVPWQQDAGQSLEVLASLDADWLVIDHYALDYRYERQLRPHVGRIMAIDDLADRAHDCDLLLDQNLGRNEADYQNLVPDHCSLLIGPRFALLRPEFARLRDYSLNRRKHPKLRKLLITMGGVDKDNATGLVLEALKSCHLPVDCQIDVVMGASAPWLGKVQGMATQMPWPTEVFVNIDDMAQRMADADLAIGAAGSTTWERCCLGLPTIIVVLADNQRSTAHALNEGGVAIVVVSSDMVGNTLSSLLADEDLNTHLSIMTKVSSDMIDGLGCRRVADKLEIRS